MPSSFVDVCRFNPTTGGTTDWTFASAVTGYQGLAAAGVINGAQYSYRAESADLTQWEVGTGAVNTATGVLPRTTVLYNSAGTGTGSGQSGAGSKINFTLTPQVAIVALAEDLQHRIYLLQISRATSAAGANVSYTGLPFKPKALIATGGLNGVNGYVTYTGLVDQTLAMGLTGSFGSTGGVVSPDFIWIGDATGNNAIFADIVSFDANGFTLSWQRFGSPTSGTAVIYVLCFE